MIPPILAITIIINITTTTIIIINIVTIIFIMIIITAPNTAESQLGNIQAQCISGPIMTLISITFFDFFIF